MSDGTVVLGIFDNEADAEPDHESRRGSPNHLTATRLQWVPGWTTVSERHALPNVEVDA